MGETTGKQRQVRPVSERSERAESQGVAMRRGSPREESVCPLTGFCLDSSVLGTLGEGLSLPKKALLDAVCLGFSLVQGSFNDLSGLVPITGPFTEISGPWQHGGENKDKAPLPICRPPT